MPGASNITVAEFGRHISPGSVFLHEEEQIAREAGLLPYAHYLRHAWRQLNLSGVLCVDGRPTVYVCEGMRFTQQQKRDKHLLVWNQGLASLLVLLTPDRVEVHSTIKKPEEKSGDQELLERDLPSLILHLGKVSEALECARLVRSIETGQFFHDHAEFFPANETVDRCLIENLTYTARRLNESGWPLSRAHSLLGRVLFVLFLHERGFIKPHFYPAGATRFLDMLAAKSIQEGKRLLYREFFPKLRREFNGTMFDSALTDEEQHVEQIHLDILADFLSGQDMQSGQTTLGFWAYDFRFIPVEVISAIYEEFMKDSALGRRRQEGAYYTPRHLAETTMHIALEGRYPAVDKWRVLDPACGSGIFLVAMFNLLAEKWQRTNSNSRKQTKAQALLEIVQKQIKGVDISLDACRIAAFSLYLALFERLQPIDVDEFKEKVRHEQFLPPLLWDKDGGEPKPEVPVIIRGDFLKDELPLDKNFDLVIGNPPWESRGSEQIALRFAKHSPEFLRPSGIGCLLLPSALLVNRYGTLGGDWFRALTVEKIVQLADFRFVLFEATHPCFIIRYLKSAPTLEHIVRYDTPKLNRFDRRTGVIIVEPDDQKLVSQRDVLEAALHRKLQTVWSRKFWGTPRDETFLRRLDFLPSISDAISKRVWDRGVGFQPFYPGASQCEPEPLDPWKLSDQFLPNEGDFPKLVVNDQDFSTLGKWLEAAVHRDRNIRASLKHLRRKPDDAVFTPPMVIYSKGFTKCAFCNSTRKVRFPDGLRSITGPEGDADLLRFLAAVMSSRLFKYLSFHSGSNSGIARDQFHLYETLALPFPLPDHELVAEDAQAIVAEVAAIITTIETKGRDANDFRRAELAEVSAADLEKLVHRYYSVTDAEQILVEDTLAISQPSIHRSSLDAAAPSLVFPELPDRSRYAATLCSVLNRRARKEGIQISAQGIASKPLNLILLTVFFADTAKPYAERGGEDKLWQELGRLSRAAQRQNGHFSYLRGFSYFEHDRLYMLKPATMRNWCRTAALNDADAIFEHLTAGN